MPMLFLFVDETSDDKFPDYLGICIATINSNFYRLIKEQVHEALNEAGWSPMVEFKGSYLFSAKRGCDDVHVETRVDAAKSILDLTTSNINKRIHFYYFKTKSSDHKRDYLRFLPPLIKKSLPQPPKKGGKDLVAVYCDERADISHEEIRDTVKPTIQSRGYTLVEDVARVRSHYETVGILYADVVGYLLGRIDNISQDHELFENIPPEKYKSHGKIRKLRSSEELIKVVKDIQKYTVKKPKTKKGS
jgi:hypothetical protein